MSILATYRRPLLVHAEIQQGLEDIVDDPRCYSTYLKARPALWEEAAIRELLTIANDTRAGGPAEGSHLHIVHLSDERSSLDLIKARVFKATKIERQTLLQNLGSNLSKQKTHKIMSVHARSVRESSRGSDPIHNSSPLSSLVYAHDP